MSRSAYVGGPTPHYRTDCSKRDAAIAAAQTAIENAQTALDEAQLAYDNANELLTKYIGTIPL